MKAVALSRMAICAVLAAPLASAAHSLPTELPGVQSKEMGPKGSAQAFRTLQEFADCLLKRGPAASAKLLGTDYPSKEADTRARALAGDYRFCLSSTPILRLTTEYLRGALIEAAYRNTLVAAGDAIPIPLGKSSTGEMGLTPALAECVVDRRSESASRILTTRPGSPQQVRAFAALEPDLSRCAREKNVTRIHPQLLRFQLAEALYRRNSPKKPAEAAK